MAKLNVKYELIQSNGQGIVELIQFGECIAGLKNDQQKNNPAIFKNEKPYTGVITLENDFIVRVLATSTNPNYGWTLNIWLTDEEGTITKKLTDNPIQVNVNTKGRADYNGTIIWRLEFKK